MVTETVVRSMPAEWSQHHATWISWPHNRETWPRVLGQAEAAMAEVVAALAPHEIVCINVQDELQARRVESLLADRVPGDRIRLFHVATDDAWIRDYGAIVVRDSGAPAGATAVDFDYNAWGGKYPPYDRDRAVAARMAELLGLPRVHCPIVLEGGSVDVDGEGLALVTEQCLLNPNRNPSLGRSEIETWLRDLLGANECVWLGEGIDGDDTDGHIDNLARFVGPRSVVAVVTDNEADPNYRALRDNFRRLEEYRDRRGRKLDVRELPLPDPVMRGGSRLPASYANFYIANEVVLMPAFGLPADAVAAGVLADCLPSRRVVPIDCRDLIVGLGALHCLTQQIPAIVAGFEPEQ
ncbi:MAG TPA: agmatine deiminase family protein [Gammaproteobacteria bacterium]|jgi:agmatine deiminase